MKKCCKLKHYSVCVSFSFFSSFFLSIYLSFFLSFFRNSPPVGQVLVIHEVSRSHTTTHHSRQDSSGRKISSLQRPLPDNTQQSQQTNIHAPPVGFELRRAAADLRLRTRGHWVRQCVHLVGLICSNKYGYTSTPECLHGTLGATFTFTLWLQILDLHQGHDQPKNLSQINARQQLIRADLYAHSNHPTNQLHKAHLTASSMTANKTHGVHCVRCHRRGFLWSNHN